MSSADYKAYVQAERQECDRLTRVYQGAEQDKQAPTEHLTIDHLAALLTTPLPQDLRSLYLRQYDEIRSNQRALAIAGMSRKDFYDVASQEMLLEKQRLADSVSFDNYIDTQLQRELPEESKLNLEQMNQVFAQRKNEILSRIRASAQDTGGRSSLTDAELTRYVMQNIDGVSSKGVSIAATTEG